MDAAASVRMKLREKRTEADRAWSKLQAAKAKAVAAGPKAVSPTSPEFLALELAGAEYDRTAGELKNAERVAALHDHGPGLTAADRLRAETGLDLGRLRTELRAWRAGEPMFAAGAGERINAAAPLQGTGWMTLIHRDDFRNAVATLTTSPISPTHRLPGVETAAGPTLELLRRVPIVPSEGSAVDWMLETTASVPAAETGEGVDVGLASEAELVYTPQTATCVDVDVTLPVALQVLADDAAAEAFFTGRLGVGALQRVQSQMISGAGAGDLLGLLNWPDVLSQDLGADTAGDAVLKAITKVRQQTKSLYEPDVLLLSPADWRGMHEAKTDAGASDYVFSPATRAPWGVLPIPHYDVPDGTALLGATASTQLVVHEDVRAHISRSHGTHFTEAVADILVRTNCYFVVRCPQAWCMIEDFAS